MTGENGLHEAVWTYQGSIIDGRNRFNACKALEIKPMFREWDGKGSLASFVISLNLHRRHLSETQRGVVADKLATMTRGRPKNTSIEVISQPEAAKMLNVSVSTVQRVAKVRKEGTPETIAAVESGKLPVSVATQHIAAMRADSDIIKSYRMHFVAKVWRQSWRLSCPGTKAQDVVTGVCALFPAR